MNFSKITYVIFLSIPVIVCFTQLHTKENGYIAKLFNPFAQSHTSKDYPSAGQFNPEADPFSFNNQYNDEINMINEEAKKRNYDSYIHYDSYIQKQKKNFVELIEKMELEEYNKKASQLSFNIATRFTYMPLLGCKPNPEMVQALNFLISDGDLKLFKKYYTFLSPESQQVLKTLYNKLDMNKIKHIKEDLDKLSIILNNELLQGEIKFSKEQLISMGFPEEAADFALNLAKFYKNLAQKKSEKDFTNTKMTWPFKQKLKNYN